MRFFLHSLLTWTRHRYRMAQLSRVTSSSWALSPSGSWHGPSDRSRFDGWRQASLCCPFGLDHLCWYCWYGPDSCSLISHLSGSPTFTSWSIAGQASSSWLQTGNLGLLPARNSSFWTPSSLQFSTFDSPHWPWSALRSAVWTSIVCSVYWASLARVLRCQFVSFCCGTQDDPRAWSSFSIDPSQI